MPEKPHAPKPHAPPVDDHDPRFAILEGAPAMLWLGDATGACVFLNAAQRAFWGPEADLPGFVWGQTLHPDDVAALGATYEQAMRRHAPFEVEARYRRVDGAWRVLHTSARPRFSAAGVFLGMVGVNTDVTDQRAAEETLRHTAEQLDLLTRELTHRIKNIFAVISGMTRLAARETPEAAAALDTLSRRIAAMAHAYTQITSPLARADRPGSLKAVFADLFAPYAGPAGERIRVEGPDLEVGTAAAVNLSLLFHELATNAAKYGALAGNGTVTLSLRHREADLLSLTWTESGAPDPVAPPTTEGFGTRLMKVSAGALGAELQPDWRPEGLLLTITLPLARLA